jgi:hypothetical protein
MLVGLDAREHGHPGHAITLTTRDPDFDSARFRECCTQWFRWLRCEVGVPVEYLGVVEFTTGRGARSGGRRRMHQHTLVKGLPADADLDALWREGKARWERLTGAYRVELRQLHSAGGATRYIVAHHHKADQAPPIGWSGKRFRPSKGYFSQPVGELRRQVAEKMRAVAATRSLQATLDNVCDEPGNFDDEEWGKLLDQLAPIEPPQVVKVTSNGSQIVVRSTGEMVRGLSPW